MKKLILLIFLVNVITGYSQTIPCCIGNDGCFMNFEQPHDSIYVKIDTNHIWFLGKAEKQILFADNPFNNHSLITDTSDYYKSNIISSFNFKLNVLSKHWATT